MQSILSKNVPLRIQKECIRLHCLVIITAWFMKTKSCVVIIVFILNTKQDINKKYIALLKILYNFQNEFYKVKTRNRNYKNEQNCSLMEIIEGFLISFCAKS
jgi:DNA gyrase/topoisomerase IV subunit A